MHPDERAATVRSFTASRIRCLRPTYRSVVWTETWPSSCLDHLALPAGTRFLARSKWPLRTFGTLPYCPGHGSHTNPSFLAICLIDSPCRGNSRSISEQVLQRDKHPSVSAVGAPLIREPGVIDARFGNPKVARVRGIEEI